ncbi:hypothetical protein D3C78_1912300 [compost metagenome]
MEKLFPNGAPAKAATVATSSASPSAANKEERLQQLMNDSDLSYEEYMRKRKAIIAE